MLVSAGDLPPAGSGSSDNFKFITRRHKDIKTKWKKARMKTQGKKEEEEGNRQKGSPKNEE